MGRRKETEAGGGLICSHHMVYGEECNGLVLSVLGRAVGLLRPPVTSPISLFLSSKQKRGREMQRRALILHQVHSEPCRCSGPLMPTPVLCGSSATTHPRSPAEGGH